jgi:hypothetical protein
MEHAGEDRQLICGVVRFFGSHGGLTGPRSLAACPSSVAPKLSSAHRAAESPPTTATTRTARASTSDAPGCSLWRLPSAPDFEFAPGMRAGLSRPSHTACVAVKAHCLRVLGRCGPDCCIWVAGRHVVPVSARPSCVLRKRRQFSHKHPCRFRWPRCHSVSWLSFCLLHACRLLLPTAPAHGLRSSAPHTQGQLLC